MAYLVLDTDEQDDMIVAFMLGQENDKHSHDLNLARYEKMIETLPEGTWKDRVTHLRDETAERIAQVDSIIEATVTLGQMPPVGRITNAKARLKAAQAAAI